MLMGSFVGTNNSPAFHNLLIYLIVIFADINTKHSVLLNLLFISFFYFFPLFVCVPCEISAFSNRISILIKDEETIDRPFRILFVRNADVMTHSMAFIRAFTESMVKWETFKSLEMTGIFSKIKIIEISRKKWRIYLLKTELKWKNAFVAFASKLWCCQRKPVRSNCASMFV